MYICFHSVQKTKDHSTPLKSKIHVVLLSTKTWDKTSTHVTSPHNGEKLTNSKHSKNIKVTRSPWKHVFFFRYKEKKSENQYTYVSHLLLPFTRLSHTVLGYVFSLSFSFLFLRSTNHEAFPKNETVSDSRETWNCFVGIFFTWWDFFEKEKKKRGRVKETMQNSKFCQSGWRGKKKHVHFILGFWKWVNLRACEVC